MDTHMAHLLEGLNFLQVLTLILVALLFGKDTFLPWIGEKYFGIKRVDEPAPAKPGALPRIERKMDELQLHFNHETTELLQQIRDNTAETVRKLDEFEKYGVPARPGRGG